MKNKGLIITLIVIFSILIVLLIGSMIFLIGNKPNVQKFNFHFAENKYKEKVLDEEFEDDFENIKIDVSASKIFIKESENYKTKVVVYSDKEKTKIDTEDRKLDIQIEEEKCVGFCFNIKVSKIEIYLPKDYANTINIMNDYGDIEVGKFSNANIKIDSNYGDTIVKGGKKVTVKEDCGDVKVGTVESADIKNNYGDIEIEEVTSYLNLKNDCGDIKIDRVSLLKNSTIKSNYGDVEIEEANDLYIDAKTDLGDVKVKKNNRKADVVLKIVNDCGDIEVNN